MDHHCQPALHVCGAEAMEPVSFERRPDLTLKRHRVEVPDQHHTPLARLSDHQRIGDCLLWHSLKTLGNCVTKTGLIAGD